MYPDEGRLGETRRATATTTRQRPPTARLNAQKHAKTKTAAPTTGKSHHIQLENLANPLQTKKNQQNVQSIHEKQ
jgi:hypothetical protein